MTVNFTIGVIVFILLLILIYRCWAYSRQGHADPNKRKKRRYIDTESVEEAVPALGQPNRRIELAERPWRNGSPTQSPKFSQRTSPAPYRLEARHPEPGLNDSNSFNLDDRTGTSTVPDPLEARHPIPDFQDSNSFNLDEDTENTQGQHADSNKRKKRRYIVTETVEEAVPALGQPNRRIELAKRPVPYTVEETSTYYPGTSRLLTGNAGNNRRYSGSNNETNWRNGSPTQSPKFSPRTSPAPYPLEARHPLPGTSTVPYPIEARHPIPDLQDSNSINLDEDTAGTNVTITTQPVTASPVVVPPYPVEPRHPVPHGGAPVPGFAPHMPYPPQVPVFYPPPLGAAPYPPTVHPPYPPGPVGGSAPYPDYTGQPPSYAEAVSQAPVQPPPPVKEVYSKQSPYNPNY